ncbi:MAG TPA: S53 family peptidase [Candidatus Saccharimonadales bacterium]|nr:S53 family peptidase [Candidatus Saccharimonadales bacterium]
MRRSFWCLLAALLCGVVVLTLAGAASAQDFLYRKNPLHIKVAGAVPSNAVPADAGAPSCGTLPSGLPLICYPPSYIRAAYNYPSIASGLIGTGQTIVLVDAFGSPTIANDLAVFDKQFGIPAPPSFTVVCPQGCPAFNPNPNASHDEAGWSIETSLDVEYAHAMAPGAKIVLVVASTNSGNALNNATKYAVEHYPGSVISQSFGVPEFVVHNNNSQIKQGHANFAQARANGITVLASAGDLGATNGSAISNAAFPASDPLVTAVGGTEGLPYPNGLFSLSTAPNFYGAEQVWNEQDTTDGIVAATGGAPSLIFPVPAFQAGLNVPSRTIPDISYNAAVNGGVLVYWSALGGANAGFYIVGGTSAGSPQWASIIAIANQYSNAHGHSSLGYINPALYALAQSSTAARDLHDITVGNNQLLGTPIGYSAAPGYDWATGWGTPNVSNLVPDLVTAVFH